MPTLEELARAAQALIDESPGAPYESAANKALWFLGRGLDTVELPGAWLIPSGTTAGKVYRVTAERCDCLSSGPCWHRAAVVLITYAREQQEALRPSYADAVAAMDELYA